MENEKRKDLILGAIASGDSLFESFTKGYNNQEAKEETSTLGDEIRRLQEKINENLSDDFIKKMQDEATKLTSKLTEELKLDKNNIFVDKVTREGNLEDQTRDPMLMHEMIHCIDFCNNHSAFDNPTEISIQQSARKEETFSTDYDKYNEQVKDFLDYVAIIKEIEDFAVISVKRINNVIRYSRYKQGLPFDRNEIAMVSSSDLRTLYETLKVSYGEEFVPGHKHEMMNGWSLLPIVADKIILEFDSDDRLDKNWIYDEVHQKPLIVEEPKKK